MSKLVQDKRPDLENVIATDAPKELGLIPAWSHSTLKTFESCAYRSYISKVKRIQENFGPAAARGSEIHQKAEDYVNGTLGEFPLELKKFESQFKKKKPLTIVRPGTQSRRFTHIQDTVQTCYFAWKENKCRHYSISNKKIYSIIQVAKMFNTKVKFLPARPGERYSSALTSMNLSNKVHKLFGSIQLKDYINNIVLKS